MASGARHFPSPQRHLAGRASWTGRVPPGRGNALHLILGMGFRAYLPLPRPLPTAVYVYGLPVSVNMRRGEGSLRAGPPKQSGAP